MKVIHHFKLLIILVMIYNNINSQTNGYTPFPQMYGIWQVYKNGPLGPGLQSISSWEKYIAFGDTSIGSYIYKKVTVANNTGYPTWNGTTYVIPFGPTSFSFGYRNDTINKKVYYLDVTSGINKDTLLYDFNLNIGDTLKNTYAYSWAGSGTNSQRRIVYSIDSVLICGHYHKRYNFDCQPGGFETELIEGVGFKDRFFKTAFDGGCPFEPTYVYSTTYTLCTATLLKDYYVENQFILFPNPVLSQLEIKVPLQVSSYSILNNLGEVILYGNELSSQSINVSSLIRGIYILKIKDIEGHFYKSKFVKE